MVLLMSVIIEYLHLHTSNLSCREDMRKLDMIPEKVSALFKEKKQELIEYVANVDDVLAEKFLSEATISVEDIKVTIYSFFFVCFVLIRVCRLPSEEQPLHVSLYLYLWVQPLRTRVCNHCWMVSLSICPIHLKCM